MPFYILHIGTELFKLSTTGNLTTLSLPGSESVVDTRPLRGAVLARKRVLCNATSVNMIFDPLSMEIKLLSIEGPSTASTLAAGSSGSITGEYRYRHSFVISSSGSIITESPWSPASDPISVTDKQINVSGISTASTTSGITERRLYRTTDAGADYFLVATISGTTVSTYTDTLTDYDLSLLAATNDLGNPPGKDGTDYLRFMVAWKDRLWASPNLNPDLLYYCGLGKPYAWAEDQVFSIKPVGIDEFGVTALAPRRDELVVLKRRAVWKVIGTDETDFQVIQVAEGPGAESFDACLVIRDKVYWLGENAFWEYGPEGVKNLSRDKVHPWFATDDFFNRGRFKYAFAAYDPTSDTISLHLAAVGSSVEDRWVTYDIRQDIWLGPHKTDAFTPTCAGTVENGAGSLIPVVGSSSGSLYWNGGLPAEDDGVAIDWEVITKFHSGDAPDREHYWGELSVLSKIQTGGTVSIVPYVGGLDATAGTTLSHNLTTGRERLGRLGVGRLAGLKLKENTLGQPVEIYGYEVPVHELGRR